MELSWLCTKNIELTSHQFFPKSSDHPKTKLAGQSVMHLYFTPSAVAVGVPDVHRKPVKPRKTGKPVKPCFTTLFWFRAENLPIPNLPVCAANVSSVQTVATPFSRPPSVDTDNTAVKGRHPRNTAKTFEYSDSPLICHCWD